MREYEKRLVRQPAIMEERLVDCRCDRCGGQARCLNPAGEHGRPAPWGTLFRYVQGGSVSGPTETLDLCERCSRDLAAEVKAHPKREGVVTA